MPAAESEITGDIRAFATEGLFVRLLLGLQRERAESSIGGIRTFPLTAIYGTVSALRGKTFGGGAAPLIRKSSAQDSERIRR